MDFYNHFFLTGDAPVDLLDKVYSPYMVVVSYVIAVVASYVALDMGAHLRQPMTRVFRFLWITLGALVMGIGMWAVHFVGMLAFVTDIPINWFWTGLSLVVAIIACFAAFTLFAIRVPQSKHYLMSGAALGTAIFTMYCVGMMGLEGIEVHYKPVAFVLALLFAIVASTAALWLSVQSTHGTLAARTSLKVGSALLMGLAIVGMHYIGMSTAVFMPAEVADRGLVMDTATLSVSVTVISLSVMFSALLGSVYKHATDVRLQNKNDFLETILKTMTGGVIAFDDKGTINLFNRTAAELYGSALEIGASVEKWSKKLLFFSASSFNKKLTLEENPLYRAVNGEKITGLEFVVKDKKGENRSLIIDGQTLRGAGGENIGSIIVFNDISKRKIDEEELKYRATHDMMTGLPNRLLLLDRLQHAVSSAKRRGLKAVVIFLDLDNFKLINDALGHGIGDGLLKMVAARFTLLLRSTDTLARLGGDEFVVILPDLENIVSMPQFLNRILHEISLPYSIDGHEVNVTCSLGFSVYPDNGEDPETLLKNADNAMYQAKEEGKNTFKFYAGDMETQVRKRFEVENDLRHALINEEFFLEYQPKLDIKSNDLVGFEALVRWQHPKYGVIPPNDFIPVTEDTGLIIPLGKWVLETACKQNKAWQDSGLPPLCVSVNLSPRQCKEKNIFQTVKEVLHKTNLEPKYLELELTESLAMSKPKEFMKLLLQFKKLGIKTSIDDFGTGYSNLNYLRQFPVNCLKIDQTFIKEIERHTNDRSIVKAIVSLGHSLNMNVIAEGVETKEQLLELQEQDCDEIQGFYLSRPISADEMTEFQKHYVALHHPNLPSHALNGTGKIPKKSKTVTKSKKPKTTSKKPKTPDNPLA